MAVGRISVCQTANGQEMYYYALKMDDSSVLRVSRGMDTVWNTAL